MNWELALKVNKFIHEECIGGVPHDVGANVMKLIEENLKAEYLTVLTIKDSLKFMEMAEKESDNWIDISKFRSDINADRHSYYEGCLNGIRKSFSLKIKEFIKEISEEEIIHHALRFAFKTCPTGEKGELLDFDKRKKTFYKCVKWFVDNYGPLMIDKTNE